MKSCKINQTYDEMKQDQQQLLAQLSPVLRNFDMAAYVETVGINVTLSQVKCWWNNKVTKCKNEFERSAIDGHVCFVFNQNSSVIAGGSTAFTGNILIIPLTLFKIIF